MYHIGANSLPHGYRQAAVRRPSAGAWSRSLRKRGGACWRVPCRDRGMDTEMILGRGLAFCCHPFAAWRVLPRSRRLLLAGAYFAASYVTTLLALMTL